MTKTKERYAFYRELRNGEILTNSNVSHITFELGILKIEIMIKVLRAGYVSA